MKNRISTFIQSTEDKVKILSSIAEVFSISDIHHIAEFTELKGHYGNSVTHVDISLKDDEAREILKIIVTRLRDSDKNQLAGNLEDYMDKSGNLYIRLDKQELCLKRLVMTQAEAVRIVLKPPRGELERLLGSWVR